jgi:hypothetical protein
MSTIIIRFWKAFFFVIAAVFVALVALLVYHETRIPQNQGEVLNRMIELQKEGRYDKAAQVAQNWMNDRRRDISGDGFLYEQIAIVYTAKAYKKPGTRSESLHLAELNLKNALDLFEKEEHKDLNLDLFEIGGGYEILADISNKDKCRMYKNARELFVRQLPLVKGDSYTAYGHTTQLEPVRRDVRKHLDAVNEKIVKAGCQADSAK